MAKMVDTTSVFLTIVILAVACSPARPSADRVALGPGMAIPVCDIPEQDAVRILEGPPPEATDWEYGFALICAGDFFSRAGRTSDAVVVLSRAIEQADSIEDRSLSASAYWRLGEVYYATGDGPSVVNAWDQLSELEAHLGTRAFRFHLATEMLSLANEAYASNDVERALDLAVRLERYHEGRDYGLSHSDPDWLPDVYLQLGNPSRAMTIHQARVAQARELGEPLEVSKRLDHYSNFLREIGDTKRAIATHEEADRLRTQRLLELNVTEESLSRIQE